MICRLLPSRPAGIVISSNQSVQLAVQPVNQLTARSSQLAYAKENARVRIPSPKPIFVVN